MSELAIPFRTGRRSPSVAPIASGRFAYLEMEDRRRKRKTLVTPQPDARREAHRDPSLRLLEAWTPIEAELRKSVDELTFRIWLAAGGQVDLHPHSLIGGTWRLAARHQSCWIEDRFGRLLSTCAGCPVEIVVCDGAQS